MMSARTFPTLSLIFFMITVTAWHRQYCLSVTLCLEYSRHHTLLGSLLSPGWGKLQNTFYQQMESTLENLLENSLEKCFKNISSISNSKY